MPRRLYEKLRILVMTIVHDPEDARIRYRQIPALLDAGHDVYYAAPFGTFERQPPEDIEAIELPLAIGRRRLHAVRAARRRLWELRDHVDVVLLHDPDLLLAAVGLTHLLPTVIWDVHEDTAAALSMRQWAPRLLRAVLSWGVRIAEHWAERRLRLLLAEHSYVERFRHSHPVVPNSVWIANEIAFQPTSTRVVYLGKVTSARGGNELIDVAKHLPEFQVEVLGSADETMRSAMESAHRAGVLTWSGFVPNDEALARLKGAMAGLALLRDEPNYARSAPTKIMEYMAHGVPTITTPNEMSQEIVERSGGGVVVAFDDVSAVVDVLRQWAANPARRRQMSLSGHQYVTEHFNWGRDRKAFVRLVEEAAQAHRG